MSKMSLHWPVDLLGYEIRPCEDVGTSFLTGDAGPVIAGKGGDVGRYDCLQKDGLYERLAACPTSEEGILKFVNEYGLLTDDKISLVGGFRNSVEVINQLLWAKRTRKWEMLRDWMKENSAAIQLHPVLLEGETPQLFFRPARLKDAIYLQFFEDLSSGAELKRCEREGCSEWFKYGPGSDPPRRRTAQFCSPKCQKAHEYVRKKERVS